MRLNDTEIDLGLASLAGWRREDGAIVADYRFRDFVAAFAFMTKVAAAAEELRHHPDWRNSFSHVAIRLTTHDQGGVTELDLALAWRIHAIYAGG